MRCCDIHAGMLREPITIERVSRSANGKGGWTETWATLSGAPVKAHVKAISGRERFASDRVEATTRYRMVIRYFDGLKESDRVIIRDRVHNIRFIDNVEMRDRWLKIDLDGGMAT